MAEAERTAEVSRRTKETGVELTLRLDGMGAVSYTHLTLPTICSV